MCHKTLNGMLMDKLASSKILADDVRDIKKTPHDSLIFDDIAKMITKNIEETAVVERTEAQRADHAKMLLDQLNGQKPRDNKKAAAGKKATDADDDEAERIPKAKMTPEEKKENEKLNN